MNQEQLPTEETEEGKLLTPEEKQLNSLEKRKKEIEGGFSSEELMEKETRDSFDEAILNVNKEIEKILEKE